MTALQKPMEEREQEWGGHCSKVGRPDNGTATQHRSGDGNGSTPACHVDQGGHSVLPTRCRCSRSWTSRPRSSPLMEWEYDCISRKAISEALIEVPGGSVALPTVRHGQPSRSLWEDQFVVVHNVHQGEGGEQGDAVGKTQVWNGAGFRPQTCDMLEEISASVRPRGQVWKRSGVPTTSECGVRILGTLVGHEDCVQAHQTRTVVQHDCLEHAPMTF